VNIIKLKEKNTEHKQVKYLKVDGGVKQTIPYWPVATCSTVGGGFEFK
jgi:hypothetical protein